MKKLDKKLSLTKMKEKLSKEYSNTLMSWTEDALTYNNFKQLWTNLDAISVRKKSMLFLINMTLTKQEKCNFKKIKFYILILIFFINLYIDRIRNYKI